MDNYDASPGGIGGIVAALLIPAIIIFVILIIAYVVKYNPKSFFLQKKQIGLLFSIIGIMLIVISQTINFTKTTTTDPYNSNKSAGLPDAFNAHIQLNETSIDTQKKNEFLFLGLGFFIIGDVLFIHDFNNPIRPSAPNELSDN